MTTQKLTPAAGTPGVPNRIWVVIRPGERHLILKEPIEGIAVWAKGVDATVLEYTFAAVIHTPPPKKKESLKP